MRILVIGSGAREHALVWKLAQSQRVSKIYAAPGNPGIAELAELLSLKETNLTGLADFAESHQINLTIVGPEVPLIKGIVDLFRARSLPIFGPDRAGAALEGSKAFTKELLLDAGIPTAQHQTFTDSEKALDYVKHHGAPVVVKADGQAAGKGAIVALDLETAIKAVRQMMVEHVFGAAGETVVIEDYVQGDEIGVTAICSGTDFLAFPLSQDHKRSLDGDQGLNTGGMGVYTPLPFVNQEQRQEMLTSIIGRTLEVLGQKGIPFTGVLYANVMLTDRGPIVLEHNTRFGDPETQAFMRLLKGDLLDLLEFPRTKPQAHEIWRPGHTISLTMASGGYPGEYRKGLPISGIEEANRLPQVQVFHAGTALKDGQIVTNGGRVLSLTAYGETLQEARDRVYEAANRIKFEGMFYRHDIAHRAL